MCYLLMSLAAVSALFIPVRIAEKYFTVITACYFAAAGVIFLVFA